MKQRHVYLLVLALVLAPTPAFAYLDPGSASIALQALVGAVAAGLFAMKVYWQKLKTFFGIGKNTENKKDQKK